MKTFEDIGLCPQIEGAINQLGFTTPTLIQGKSIPLIIEGKDILGESATGSGKTLAFGIGAVDNAKPNAGLQGLIITPTRELAEQVQKVIIEVSYKKKLNIITVYGGVNFDRQVSALKKANIVVATPGRLLDHMQQGTIKLNEINTLVLDEADRMLDMGFIDDVEKIIRACPKDRQTLFFSATLAPQIKRLASKYMYEPEAVHATKMVNPDKLRQVYYDVRSNNKLSLLVHLMKEEDSGLVIVFSNTRRNTEFIVKNLRANKVDAVAIHGGMTQNKRQRTLDDFNAGRSHVLVCTDVAARGIHINNVSHVVNYDIPKDPKDYVHRIGRTARAGEEGEVVNLLSEQDHVNFGRIGREYRDYKIDRAEKPETMKIRVVLDRAPARGGRGFRGGGRGRDSRGPPRSGGRFGRDSRGPPRSGGRFGRSEGRSSYGRSRDSGRSDRRDSEGRSGGSFGRSERSSFGRDSERRDDRSSSRGGPRRSNGRVERRDNRFEGRGSGPRRSGPRRSFSRSRR